MPPIDVIRAALKGREPLIYARVSTTEQKGTLPAQVETVKKWLKSEGIKRKPRVFMEQVSGSKRLSERKALAEMITYAESKPGKVAIVVRDTQRFSRNPWIVGAIYDPLRQIDVPLISSEAGGKVASTDKTPQVEGDLLMPILTTIGSHEIALRTQQTLLGLEESKAAGIWPGQPLSLYSSEPMNPYRELLRLRPLLVTKELPQARAASRLEKSTSWLRKTLKRISDIEATVGDDGLRDWLNTTDNLRKIEQQYPGKKWAAGIKAVRRMTGGYLAEPHNWPMPTPEQMLEYLENPKQYQPKRTH